MAERAIFLDRDNTIIENDGYLGDPAKVKLLPGAGAALAALRALGYRLIVVSNQSGVGRGMFKEADVEAVNDEMSRQLKQQAGAYVDASYYCPYHPEASVAEYRADHTWRKPKAGMLFQAAADFGLDLKQCWMVGDSWRDVAAGIAAGCRTILLKDPQIKASPDEQPKAGTGAPIVPNFVVRALGDAARIIVREGPQQPLPVAAPVVPAVPMPAADAPRAPIIALPGAATPPFSAGGRTLVMHEWRDDENTPLHLHHADDEAWHVLEGTLKFRLADRELDAPAGSTVFVPAGVPHAYQCTGARYLIILTPRLAALIAALEAAPDPAQHADIYRRHASELLA